jgi:F-type H+-transporting ATPase subunit epsilon
VSAEEGRARTLRVELVTPEGPVFSDEARMVIVPGAEGELGVLPRHAPLIARLDAGETRIRRSDGAEPERYATGSGFFQVDGETAVVLVGHAEKADEIDVARAEADRDAATRRLDELPDDEDNALERRRAQRELDDAESRLRIAGR